MGTEIGCTCFEAADFERFGARLRAETALLCEWIAAGRLAQDAFVTGFELEGWLVDANFLPNPVNQRYLARLAHPLVVPELSTFNVELNGTPQPLAGGGLRAMEAEFEQTWRHCARVAQELDSRLVMIGILPTVREEHLCLEHMSPLNRYHALNEQVLRAREGRPLHLHIEGREALDLFHRDVMLEAGTTSFQVHIQVPADRAERYYNASAILSAPMVAVSANSPYLFGRDLWAETRIPLFEQAVDVSDDAHPHIRRVTFGNGYLESSIAEAFRENLEVYPVLLPLCCNDGGDGLCHLRLHNGTLWRWNRPLIGFDAAGTPHVRIEHRVLPAGPSIVDMMANAALYLGAVHALAGRAEPPESRLPFATARQNFYRAARDGLEAEVHWLGGRPVAVADLLADEILPLAEAGLRDLGVAAEVRARYLSVIRARVGTRQTGAAWQRAHVARHGRDFPRLTACYLDHQRSGLPVHQWPV